MGARRQLANAIRALSMDAVQQARSGHPGAPMGMADVAQVLWCDYLRHNPADPEWANRDRFVLSNGHGSMLLYSLLHLTGYDVSMQSLRDFRQWESGTPGHPEYGDTPGVETTTGPLGQGLANAVGMAVAEKVLAARFNREDGGVRHTIVDHRTWVFAGDGCLMEGVSHEAASLAGTLALGKLTCIYDDNGISIDGEVSGWFTDDTPGRFRAYGWHVVEDVDGHDPDALAAALDAAVAETARPTIICCKTQIGYGSPAKAGTAASHGAPLGEDEVAATREALGWTHAPFEVPDDVYSGWDCKATGAAQQNAWNQQFAEYAQKYPQDAAELERRLRGELPEAWTSTMDSLLLEAQTKGETLASRNASGNVIGVMARLLPELIGGSADLSGSNCTHWPEARPLSADDGDANYVYYGVREFGMTAIANGIALHGGLVPFTGTFLMFMEYARNAARMSSLMGIRNIHVYTHDSIGQGEDGPTHQPVEQLTNLRTTPGMATWRPCDAVETVAAWRAAVERTDGPTALVFSRQGLPHQERSADQLRDIARGAYVLKRESGEGTPDIVLIATGSEVGLAVDAAAALETDGVRTRVVSMPSASAFEAQPAGYIEDVLPPAARSRVAIEAAHPDYWYKWVGFEGAVVGLDRFGASAPGGVVMDKLGFNVANVVKTARGLLG